MGKSKINYKHLSKLSLPNARIEGIALNALQANFKDKDRTYKLKLLQKIINKPNEYLNHEVFGQLANELYLIHQKNEEKNNYQLNNQANNFNIFGATEIEASALHQMELAMRLPVSVAGALMPDAHYGYGLPIGGVLATKNQVIPYAVGVDIGCRMCLSVFDIPATYITSHQHLLKDVLVNNTRFGNKHIFDKVLPTDFIDKDEFNTTDLLKSLKDKAYKQLGTSGGGNHFVEFGQLTINETQNKMNLAPGNYFALLSHSGSRGLGASIANHYTKIAIEKSQLIQEAKHLSWLDLDTNEGIEYWIAMHLAGDYASECHHQIHTRIASVLGAEILGRVENHHNYAWKENGLIVHRKGATPAAKGVLGIIPGSMASPAYVVEGKGNIASLNSASHGAGRKMSRAAAKSQFTMSALKKELSSKGISLIGAGVDEAPFAYKDIEKIISLQSNLVDVLGAFTPKIVRMDGAK